MNARAKLLSSEQVFAGRVFGVRRDVVVEPGGARAVRDVVTHHGSVVLLPLLSGGRIVMVRQYRHAVGGFLWELCAGRIEPGESPRAAARRELREETGYTAKRFRKLLNFFPSPGFVSERMILYAADGLTEGETEPDADEAIETQSFRLSELERWIRDGKIRDGKTVAGILYYARFILRRRT